MWYTQITENDLGELVLSRFSVNSCNILYTLIKFCRRIILKRWINQTWIKSELSSVRGDLQHIVDRRINISCIDRVSSVSKFVNKLFLKRSCFNLNNFVFTIRNIEFQRISSTNVSNLLKHRHKFRKSRILCYPRSLLEFVSSRS